MKKTLYTLMLIGLASCNSVEKIDHELLVTGEGYEFVIKIHDIEGASGPNLVRQAKFQLSESGFSTEKLNNIKIKVVN